MFMLSSLQNIIKAKYERLELPEKLIIIALWLIYHALSKRASTKGRSEGENPRRARCERKGKSEATGKAKERSGLAKGAKR